MAEKKLTGFWVWMVVLVGFVLNFVSIGSTYASGVFFLSLLEYFGHGESVTAWIASVQDSTLYFTGLIIAPLLQRFTYRQTIIFACFLTAAGYALSAPAPNVYFLYITYGLLTGIGNGLMYITSLVVTQQYVTEMRATAAGIVATGGGVGIMCFSLLVKAGLSWKGWRIALLLEAGLVMLCATCALLVKPLPQDKEEPGTESETTPILQSYDDVQASKNTLDKLQNVNEKNKTIRDNNAENNLQETKYHEKNIMNNLRDVVHKENKSVIEVWRSLEKDKSDELEEYSPLDGRTVRQDSGYSECNDKLDVSDSDKKDPDMSAYRYCEDSDDVINDKADKKKLSLGSGCYQAISSFFSSICDKELARSPELYLIGIAYAVYAFGFGGVFVYIAERTKHICEVNDDDANFMVIVLGMSSVAGRLLFGFAGDIGPRFRYVLEAVSLLIAGIASFAVTATSSYTLSIVYCIFEGFTIGGFASLMSLLILDSFGPDLLAKATGMCMVADGIGGLIGPPLLGWIIEHTSDMDNAFICLGVVDTVGGLAVIAVFIYVECFPRPHSRQYESIDEDSVETGVSNTKNRRK